MYSAPAARRALGSPCGSSYETHMGHHRVIVEPTRAFYPSCPPRAFGSLVDATGARRIERCWTELLVGGPPRRRLFAYGRATPRALGPLLFSQPHTPLASTFAPPPPGPAAPPRRTPAHPVPLASPPETP